MRDDLQTSPPRAPAELARPRPVPPRRSTDGTHALPEQHSLARSIILHLAPGAAMTLFIVALAPVVTAWGFPAIFALFLGIAVVIVPLELGYLAWHARRRTGSWSPWRAVAYRTPLRKRTYALWGAALAAWFIVVISLSIAFVDEWLANTLFGWLPASISEFATFEDDATHARWAIAVLLVVAFVFNGVVGPVTEELYFRGHLLPALERLGARAPVLNAVLFSLYHLWTPWQNPGRILALLPWLYVVWRKRSVELSIVVHVTVNVTFLLMILAFYL